MSRLRQKLATPSARYLRREESMPLSNSEWDAHRALCAGIRSGAIDYEQFLVEAPARVTAILTEEKSS